MGIPIPTDVCAELGISRHAELTAHTYDVRKIRLQTTAGVIDAWLIVFEIGNDRVAIPFDRDTLHDFGEKCLHETTGLVLASTTKGITTHDT